MDFTLLIFHFLDQIRPETSQELPGKSPGSYQFYAFLRHKLLKKQFLATFGQYELSFLVEISQGKYLHLYSSTWTSIPQILVEKLLVVVEFYLCKVREKLRIPVFGPDVCAPLRRFDPRYARCPYDRTKALVRFEPTTLRIAHS